MGGMWVSKAYVLAGRARGTGHEGRCERAGGMCISGMCVLTGRFEGNVVHGPLPSWKVGARRELCISSACVSAGGVHSGWGALGGWWGVHSGWGALGGWWSAG